MELYHCTNIADLKWINPRVSNAYKDMGPLVFASPVMGYAACFAYPWNSEHARIDVNHNEDSDEPKFYNVNRITFTVKKRYIDLDNDAYLYRIDPNWFTHLHYYDDLEYVSRKKAFVIKTIKMKWRDLLKRCDVEVVEI